MVHKPDIEYIDKFYVHGSEAKVIEFAPNKRKAKATLPKPLQEKKLCIEVDPIALCGLIVAVVMLVVMAVGLLDFKAAVEANSVAAEKLQEVRNEHVMKEYRYRTSYNVALVEETAVAMGMVPADQIPVVAIEASIPEEKEEYTVWGDFIWSLSCLFGE